MGREEESLRELVATCHCLTPSVRAAIIDLIPSGSEFAPGSTVKLPRGPPLPIFFAQARDQIVVCVHGPKNFDRASVAR